MSGLYPAALAVPLLFAAALPAHGLIAQGDPAGIAVPTSVSDAFGRWGTNAGAIAVAPDWVLSSRHQDSLATPPNRTVVFGGTSYKALSGDPANVVNLNQDLRLVRITNLDDTPATLTTTLSVYDGPVLTAGTALTLGGFGPSRGTAGSDGFDYAGTLTNGNGLRFGTNTLDLSDTVDDPGEFYDGMAVLVADFDNAGSPATSAESTLGPGDSGGAWLVDDGGTFKIAGLSFSISEPRVDDPATPVDEATYTDAYFTQLLFAADATGFAATINTIPEPASAALVLIAAPALLRRRR